jgi:S-adenosylmethionine:tRNA-ribosyltransferase-isomerase (queuine synthetase)
MTWVSVTHVHGHSSPKRRAEFNRAKEPQEPTNPPTNRFHARRRFQTTGLHFSKHLWKVRNQMLTPHRRFRNVQSIWSRAQMSQDPAEACDRTVPKQKKRICTVGRPPCVVESSVSSQNTNLLMDGLINCFPPHDFAIPTCMITNFHTPKSTLLMMVSAFVDESAYENVSKTIGNFLVI